MSEMMDGVLIDAGGSLIGAVIVEMCEIHLITTNINLLASRTKTLPAESKTWG